MKPAIALLSALLFFGCATGGSKSEVEGKALALTLTSQEAVADSTVIDRGAKEIELRAELDEAAPRPLVHRFQLDRRLVPTPQAKLRFELSDLPLGVEGRKISGGLWEIELPPNMIQLLRSKGEKVTYTGRLFLDKSRQKSLPVALVLTPVEKPKPKHASRKVRRHSAG